MVANIIVQSVLPTPIVNLHLSLVFPAEQASKQTAMSPSLLFSILLFLLATRAVDGAFCNDYTISRIIYAKITTKSPIFRPEIELYGDASVLPTHTRLTKAEKKSYGGFFLAAPTEFQGPGGFSMKFALKSFGVGGGNGGDAWEFIIARGDAAVLPAPFARGNSAHGKAGWSRKGALVVEFDARNSGSGEKDSSENHISVFLDGTEECETKYSGNFDDGQKRTVWVDFIGFKSTLEVYISSSGKRPNSPTLRCSVDIWSKLAINSRYHVGFAAYNHPTASAGIEHALVDGISVSDAYRPFDAKYCATYAPCRAKDRNVLCIVPISPGTCQLKRCGRSYVWDVDGDLCCGFIEKASWILKPGYNRTGNFDKEGDTAPCIQDRRTISFTANDRFCNL